MKNPFILKDSMIQCTRPNSFLDSERQNDFNTFLPPLPPSSFFLSDEGEIINEPNCDEFFTRTRSCNDAEVEEDSATVVTSRTQWLNPLYNDIDNYVKLSNQDLARAKY